MVAKKATAVHPDILILDEIMATGDKASRTRPCGACAI